MALRFWEAPFGLRLGQGQLGLKTRPKANWLIIMFPFKYTLNYYRCGTSIEKSCVSRKWSSQAGLSKKLVCRREIKWLFGELETHFTFQRTRCTDWHGRKLGWGQWMTMGASWYRGHETGMETKHDYKWIKIEDHLPITGVSWYMMGI